MGFFLQIEQWPEEKFSEEMKKLCDCKQQRQKQQQHKQQHTKLTDWLHGWLNEMYWCQHRGLAAF